LEGDLLVFVGLAQGCPPPLAGGGEVRHPFSCSAHALITPKPRSAQAYLTGTQSHMLCPYISPFSHGLRRKTTLANTPSNMDKTLSFH